MDLVEILKSAEGTLDLFRDLLDLICKRFPPEDRSGDGEGWYLRAGLTTPKTGWIFVSHYGFQLLEAAEAEMGSTEQTFNWIETKDLKDPLLSAVASRLTRQGDNVDIHNVDIHPKVLVRSHILCGGEESALAISSLMQHCRRLNLRSLKVAKDIGTEGWAALRRALSSKQHHVPHLDVGFKIYLASARREDVRAIWECVSHSWEFSGENVVLEGEDGGEEGWRTLEQFLDLTKAEWIEVMREAVMAQLQAAVEPDGFDFLAVNAYGVPQVLHVEPADGNFVMNMGGQQVPVPLEGLALMQLVVHHHQHQHLAAEGDQVEVEDQQQQLDGDQVGGGPGDQLDGDQVEEEEQVQDQQEGDPEGDY